MSTCSHDSCTVCANIGEVTVQTIVEACFSCQTVTLQDLLKALSKLAVE